MYSNRHAVLIKAIALVLCVIFAVPTIAMAAATPEVQPCASDYLGGYQTYICAVGGGKVQVWFDVVGAGTQDELGVLSIILYESSNKQTWTRVKTFTFENYSNMLGYNKPAHMSHVTYQGVAGRYYKAYVGFWGGSDGNGDNRYVWASPERAT